MKRRHAVLVSLIIGVAAIFGTFAATQSVRLGRTAQSVVSSAQIAARNRALDRKEAALHRILAAKRAGAPATKRSGPQRVIYVRPAPHVVTLHHHGSDDGPERESEGARFDD
jgi:hypothetical protein